MLEWLGYTVRIEEIKINRVKIALLIVHNINSKPKCMRLRHDSAGAARDSFLKADDAVLESGRNIPGGRLVPYRRGSFLRAFFDAKNRRSKETDDDGPYRAVFGGLDDHGVDPRRRGSMGQSALSGHLFAEMYKNSNLI